MAKRELDFETPAAREFKLPRDDEHTYVIGRNGTGKTQLGGWLLSKRNVKRMPWVILDYKRDELLNSIERTREIGFNEIPSKPGLYILHASPADDKDMENWLWRVWGNGHVGLYADEGYMLPQIERGAFDSILTQGRSLRIPVIGLSQRPVKVTRFLPSEATHFGFFDLNDRRDKKTLEEFLPEGMLEWVPDELKETSRGTRLPPFHARWYDKKRHAGFVLLPVPEADTIRADIDKKLEPKRRWF